MCVDVYRRWMKNVGTGDNEKSLWMLYCFKKYIFILILRQRRIYGYKMCGPSGFWEINGVVICC